MAKKVINWRRIWQEFEDWNCTIKPPVCKMCGQKQLFYDAPWELQQKKIEELLYQQDVIINWHQVWKQLNSWLTPFECKCMACDRLLQEFPEWSDQQDEIQRIVNKQLKG